MLIDASSAATKYLETHPLPVDVKNYDENCGVGTIVLLRDSSPGLLIHSRGFSITPEELYSGVVRYVQSNSITGWTSLGSTLAGLKATELRWANALELKNCVEKTFAEMFGAKELSKPKTKVLMVPYFVTHTGHLMDEGT